MAEKPIDPSLQMTGAENGPLRSPTAGTGDRFSADLKPLQELDAALTKLNTNINRLKTDLPKVINLTEQWAAKMQKVTNAMKGMGGGMPGGGGGAPGGGGGGGSGYIPAAGSLTSSVLGGSNVYFGNVTYQTDRSQTANVYGAGGGRGGAASTTSAIADAISKAVGALGTAINNRIGENAQYSLSANRMDMLYQQMTGMGGGAVRQNFRAPLQQYKLGMGGINQVLALQASTGINAQQQARSVEALRVASGYGYNTEQINQMTRGLASAESSNRMFMMMGTGLYGVGGKQRSTIDVVKDTVRRLGLNSESALRGAMAPGSFTRERMRQSGLPEDMQDLVLQYARENVAFRKKGGKGMYSPESAADRKRMGVENTYANQYEETERTKVNREESMYNKQADNYAAMERQMQSLTRTMQRLEEAMAGIIGLKIRNRGVGGIAKGIAGPVGGVIGGIAGSFFGPGGTAAGSMLGSSIGNIVGNFLGDPTGEKGGPKEASGNITRSQGQLQKIHPKMRERLERMMKDNPRLYIGGGVRSTEQQKQMFLNRYQPTNEKTDIFWKGQYWKRVRGAAAAPPGMSMHEIGLAVDLAPATEFDWIKQNAAKYGLRSFFDVNNEPWHVQPAELPASRVKYEQMGAPWGHNGVVADPTDQKAVIKGMENMEHQSISSMGGVGGKGIKMEILGYSGLSMGETIQAMAVQGSNNIGGVAAGGTRVGSVSRIGIKNDGDVQLTSPKSPRYINPTQLASLLYNAGFRGKDLEAMMGIAARETSGFNASALNPNGRDYSFGLFQINMKDDDPANKNMGKHRLKMFGITKPEDLYDPATNVRAAKVLFDVYKNSGKNPFTPWLGSKNAKALGKVAHHDTSGKPHTYDDYGTGQKLLKDAGFKSTAGGWSPSGDPIMDMAPRPSSGGNVTIQSGGGATYQVTISPTIHLNGGNNPNIDVQRMAREVTKLLDREVRMTLMRTT